MSVEPHRGAAGGSRYGRRPAKVNPNDVDPVTGKPPAKALGTTPRSALDYMLRGQLKTDAYFRAHGHTGSFGELAGHIADTALGLLGTDRKLVGYAARHPVGRLENKGPFAIPPGAIIGGTVPWFGGPAGGLRGAARVARAYEPRTLTHGDLTQQLPKARSRITRAVVEKPADVVSTRLQRSERATKTPLVRLATSGERVVKAAGRSQRAEIPRAAAPMVPHLDAIKAVPAGSPEDVANFWYAQLPRSHRNAEGLGLVRDKQAEELRYVASGEALADLSKREAAVRVEIGATRSQKSPLANAYREYVVDDPFAPDRMTLEEYAARHPELSAEAPAATPATPKDVLALVRELEELKVLKSDLAQREQDAAASIGQLERLIAEPPAVNERAISAVHALGGERTRILVDAKRLHPARAEARKWLVSNWLGVTPTREFAPKVSPPKGALFHGSPEGVLPSIDTLHHTKPWREGIGFYITENLEKAKGYARGRTANAARKEAGTGAVNYVKLKPGAKVLDMDAPADMTLWRQIAEKVDPHGLTERDWQTLLGNAGRNPSNLRLRDELIDYYELGSEGLYALDETFDQLGIAATTHLEGKGDVRHRVWVVKDANAVERLGGHSLADLAPQTAPDFAALAGTDAPAYLGHRLPRPENFRGSTLPSGGTARVSSPQGVGTENRLILATGGRLRPSLRVAAEDWQSAQVFHQANVARDDLGRIGTPFKGYVPPGSVLVNPKGRTIPPHWRTDELSQFTDGYEDTEAIRKQAQEIVDEFVAQDPAGHERMKQSALEQGISWDELRVVPKRLVDRYYAQFRPSRGRSTPAKAYDAMVDAVATSIVFARVGYIPKNLVQNLVMAAPHQGVFLPQNAVKGAQAWADPQLRRILQAEVGHTGATGALGTEAMSKRFLGKIASGVGKVADDPVRFAALLHELQAAKVIPRSHPWLTPADRAALIRFYTDKANRPLVNDVRQRTVDAMADFSRMTPDQSRIARRFLIIPGWLMAGTRYPFHFAVTHPIRSALLAYIAAGEPGAPDQFTFNKPVDEYFTGSGYRRGIQTPYGRIRTNSLTPVGTPVELAQAAVGTVRGKQGPFDFSTPTIWDVVQPGIGSAVSVLQGGDLGRAGKRLVPGEQFIEQMIRPRESATYPEDKSRLGRLYRELGVVPIDVNDPSAGVSYSPPSRRHYGQRGSGGSRYGQRGGSGGSRYGRRP